MLFKKKAEAEADVIDINQEEGMKENKGVPGLLIGGCVAVIGGIASLVTYVLNKSRKTYSEISSPDDQAETAYYDEEDFEDEDGE